jgi:hypothetical protein
MNLPQIPYGDLLTAFDGVLTGTFSSQATEGYLYCWVIRYVVMTKRKRKSID